MGRARNLVKWICRKSQYIGAIQSNDIKVVLRNVTQLLEYREVGLLATRCL